MAPGQLCAAGVSARASGSRTQGDESLAPGTACTRDGLPGPLREERADDPSWPGFGSSDVPAARRRIELIFPRISHQGVWNTKNARGARATTMLRLNSVLHGHRLTEIPPTAPPLSPS